VGACARQSRSATVEGLQISTVREECERRVASLREAHSRELQLVRDDLYSSQQQCAKLHTERAESQQHVSRLQADLQALQRDLTSESELKVSFSCVFTTLIVNGDCVLLLSSVCI
jgi:uncharacterized protein (DUF3084 family)